MGILKRHETLGAAEEHRGIRTEESGHNMDNSMTHKTEEDNYILAIESSCDETAASVVRNGRERELAPLMDRTFIEYHGHPDSVVRIHYLLSQENGDEDLYVTEEMRPVYGGVCSKEFVLFFGESLQYYIMEERGRVEQLMESGELKKSETSAPEPEGRFGRINEMAVSRSLGDYDALEGQLEEFYRKEYLDRQLFRLK